MRRLFFILLLASSLVDPPTAWSQDAAPRPLLLESIRVEPDDESVRRAVEAQLRLRVGEEVEVSEVLAARETLAVSGFFESVSVYTERGSRPGAIVLVVEGELDRSPNLESGFGHEPITGWYLNLVGVRWNSPFHRGGYIRLGSRLGIRSSGIYSEWMRPRLGGDDVDLLVSLESGASRWLIHDGDDLYSQQIGRGRLRAGLRWHLGDHVSTTFYAGFSGADPKETLEGVDVPDQAAGTLVPVPNPETEGYTDLEWELRWDPKRKDEAWRDGRGAATRLRASEGHGDLDGFVRAEVDVGSAWPVGSHDALAGRVAGVFSSRTTPYHLRPTLGGTGSVRGYRDASLSGALGARATWNTSLEWRRRLLTSGDGRARVVGALFLDAGQAWDPDGTPSDVTLGVGYGLRIRVPWIQVFSIDAGIPLQPTVTNDPFWVHATLGFGF